MKTATVEAGAQTVDSGIRAHKRGGWCWEVVTVVLVAGLLLAGVEGVAFAAWEGSNDPALLPAGAVWGMVVIGAVVALAVSLGGRSAYGGGGRTVGLHWAFLAVVFGSVAAILGNAVVVPVGIQINLVEDPHLVPSTIASAEGQRTLLLNGVSVTFSLILAAAFIGLIVLRRRSA